MPPFLSEPPVILVALLGVVGLLMCGVGLVIGYVFSEQDEARSSSHGFSAFRRRYARGYGRGLLVVGVILLLLAFAWFVAGFFLESPREEAVRRVGDMADAVTEKNWTKFSENVSESFDAKGRKKADLKRVFDQGGAYNLRAVAWDFAETDRPPTDTEVVIQFEGKATAATGEPLVRHFEATFVKDPDGKFRMKTYKAFDFVQKNQPVDVP